MIAASAREAASVIRTEVAALRVALTYIVCTGRLEVGVNYEHS
jgi:hypothetical protein